jgi:hypothetical protein
VAVKIRSGRGPLIIGTARNWGIKGFWAGMEGGFEPNFGNSVQRRGVHVNIPKIGSRAGENCIGGISEFHADL